MPNCLELFFIFLKLGLTSFGGPIAHLGYFHAEFVKKRNWFDDHTYADLVALCQFLPGPASSQVGIAIGLSRAGTLGAFAAWLGFTLPSALSLVAFAYGVSIFRSLLPVGWLHGLKIIAVAVVAQALWTMTPKLCPDNKRAGIAVLAATGTCLLPFAFGQVLMIGVGALLGVLFLSEQVELPHNPLEFRITKNAAAAILSVFILLLCGLPILARATTSQAIKLFDSFFRSGALVFGGGHVILPLLKAEVVTPGWVSADAFMAGYGAAQAVPGPLFSFTAYLGTLTKLGPNGWRGALLCLVAAFLPSFFLVFGTLPFWEVFRRQRKMRSAMLGINAAVVGLLLAAFINPVCTSALLVPGDFVLAALFFALLIIWKIPAYALVAIGPVLVAIFTSLN